MCKLDPNDCKIVTMSVRKNLLLLLILGFPGFLLAQGPPDTWIIQADTINPANYYGVTVANGMIGLVSSPEPFKAKDVVLNGAFDLYGRGRVSNILKTFNFVNLYLDIDGRRIESFRQVSHLRQTLDMKRACLTTTFEDPGKATVSYTWYSLRQLRYTALVD